MTSEEFRTNPLLLRNQFERSGTFEIPLIHKEQVGLENLALIGYDKLSSGKNDQIVHFFLDDYKFEALWNNPAPRVERLSSFKAVLSPQFSIYSEMPIAIQIHNTFRNRWCGAYLQSKGLKVIPSVVWGEPDTFWFCFDGIEKNSTVAVSTIGVRNEKELFMSGYKELLRRIEPTNIICYGKPFDEMEGNIIYASYEEKIISSQKPPCLMVALGILHIAKAVEWQVAMSGFRKMTARSSIFSARKMDT